ncbi:MAG: glycosyltransferase family 4 protein [Pseudomonadota bacterium]|nr:glycosyltransferase family 4 protein [Pseudomonadota bacterium]
MVLKGYPRLSETFIAQEILELERAGFDLEIVSLRHPTDKDVHPVHHEIAAPVTYLPEYLHHEPLRVIRAWWRARRLPGYRAALKRLIRDFARDRTRNRLRRFGQGLVIAAEIAPRSACFYAHFLHTPASATRYGAVMAGKRFAISAHAKDIWTTPAWEIGEKLAECDWCVTCTEGAWKELTARAEDPGKVHLVYHGIDLSRFPAAPDRAPRNGADPDAPVALLTVGRAVAKKGIDNLIEALALLPSGLNWHWTHVGGGPLRDELEALAELRGIAGRSRFLGARPQKEVLAAYRDSDLFVLPSRIDETGDRDGLPNVIVEAMSQGLAVIATPISGIPELVADGENGLLVEPDRPHELAEAIERLARSPELRGRYAVNGERAVRNRFDHKRAIVDLVKLVRDTLSRTQQAIP